ncbi:MAG: hypothetical protein LBQ46_09740, partial [Treponema sp.]|nr:hypothetical protein [Treponema sp.]
MDIYRGEIYAEKNFLKYALFVSFFPQLVAGPIERSKNLLAQFDEVHRFDCLRRVHTPAACGGTKGMYPESNTLPKQPYPDRSAVGLV